jgi:hypothetical protein
MSKSVMNLIINPYSSIITIAGDNVFGCEKWIFITLVRLPLDMILDSVLSLTKSPDIPCCFPQSQGK